MSNEHAIPESRPAVSIIVPVYNAEKYLARCLNSILFQTLQTIEVIAVDDGSSDASLAVLREYEARFPDMMRIVEKENGGPSSARKAGIALARAEFVLFVDADDWIHPAAVELMVSAAEEAGQCDIVYACHARVRDGDTRIEKHGRLTPESEERTDLIGRIIRDGSCTSMCGKLWRKQLLIDHALFPDMWHEDCVDGPVAISFASKAAYVNEVLYYYFVNNASITTSPDDSRRRDLFKADEMCFERLNPSRRTDWKVKLATRLGWNLNFSNYYDEMVAYGKWAYERFNIAEVKEELSDAQIEKLDRILSLDPTHIAPIVYLDASRRGEYDLDNLSRALSPKFEIAWAGIDDASSYDCIRLAAQEIHATGGFFLAPEILLMRSLNPLLVKQAVFAFEARDIVSSAFFGGAAGNQAMKALVDEFAFDEHTGARRDLHEVFATVLLCSCGIHLTGKGGQGRFGSQVFSLEWFMFKPDAKRPMLRYRGLDGEKSCNSIPQQSVESYVSATDASAKKDAAAIEELKKLVAKQDRKIAKQRERVLKLRGDNAALKHALEATEPSQSRH